jgi:hypothetical protein
MKIFYSNDTLGEISSLLSKTIYVVYNTDKPRFDNIKYTTILTNRLKDDLDFLIYLKDKGLYDNQKIDIKNRLDELKFALMHCRGICFFDNNEKRKYSLDDYSYGYNLLDKVSRHIDAIIKFHETRSNKFNHYDNAILKIYGKKINENKSNYELIAKLKFDKEDNIIYEFCLSKHFESAIEKLIQYGFLTYAYQDEYGIYQIIHKDYKKCENKALLIGTYLHYMMNYNYILEKYKDNHSVGVSTSFYCGG